MKCDGGFPILSRHDNDGLAFRLLSFFLLIILAICGVLRPKCFQFTSRYSRCLLVYFFGVYECMMMCEDHAFLVCEVFVRDENLKNVHPFLFSTNQNGLSVVP